MTLAFTIAALWLALNLAVGGFRIWITSPACARRRRTVRRQGNVLHLRSAGASRK